MSRSNTIADSELVLSYQSGDKKALAFLVKRWHKKLCQQAFWYTRDMDSAKDIAQDTWQMIMVKLYDLRDANRFGSWAMTIVSRKAIDHLKKQGKPSNIAASTLATAHSEEPPETTEQLELKRMLKEKIKELPEDQRMVLTLFYIEEYSLKEISELTGATVGTVKTRLFRAREKLKKLIKTKRDEKRF